MESENNGCLYYFLMGLLILGLLAVAYLPNAITVDAAVDRFAELAKVTERDIVVVRHSNNTMIIGDTHDVTFELEIKGEPVTGRCTSGTLSPMVCRLYEG